MKWKYEVLDILKCVPSEEPKDQIVSMVDADAVKFIKWCWMFNVAVHKCNISTGEMNVDESFLSMTGVKDFAICNWNPGSVRNEFIDNVSTFKKAHD